MAAFDGPPFAAVRVVELACFEQVIPAEGGSYALSGSRQYSSFASTIVRVTADDGTSGFGEASTMGSSYLEGFAASTQAAIRELAPVVFASDPLAALPLAQAMDRAVLGHQPGKAAIDMAMWDLRARLLDVPLYLLLGGAAQTSLAAFTAVPVASTAEMVAEARRLWALGYRHLQIKVGDDPTRDAETVHAVVSAVGDLKYLSCDANGGWTTAQARRFARAVGDVDTYLEQPCPSLAEIARLRLGVTHPVVVDEAARHPRDLLDGPAAGSIDAVNIKSVRVGGITRAAQMRDCAQAARLMITIDEPMGGDLATAGILHLGATVDPDLLLAVSYAASGEADKEAFLGDGSVRVPTGPGLGVEPDPAAYGEPLYVARPAFR